MKHERDTTKIYIFDTTNRDGEQATEGAKHPIESKLEIATALAEANIDRIEAGFPTSSDGEFEAVQRTAREVYGPMIFGLSRVPVIGKEQEGIDGITRTYEAVKDAEHRGIHVFTINFDPESLEAYKTTRQKVVEGAVMGVAHARNLLGNNGQVEFSFQRVTDCPLEWIIEDNMRMVDAGANVINIPDTVGYSSPEEISYIIKTLRTELPEHVMISIHCHDDLGKAVANSLAAVKAGADIVEGTINGIGERAGNAALEEVVMNLAIRKDLYGGRTVGIKTEMLNPLSKLVSFHYDMPVPDNKAIVGANAFRHSAGIHIDGMIKGRVYEIMKPEDVGWDGESFRLTARSGYKGVDFRLRRLGYDTSDKSFRERFMLPYKILADEKGEMNDVDLVYLMNTINKDEKDKYQFVDMGISKEEDSMDYNASVVLDVDGKKIRSGKWKANWKSNVLDSHPGAIDALYTAVNEVVGKPKDLYLVSYDPINMGSGSNAVAEVTVILSKKPEFDGKIKPFDGMYVGRARHVDTLQASVMAYVNALNMIEK